MKEKKITLVADFETTINNPEHTEVWSAAYIDLEDACEPKNVFVKTDLDSFMNAMFCYDSDLDVYFHNLKFDGSFILDWLIRNDNFLELSDGEHLDGFKGVAGKQLMREYDYGYTYRVSDMGVFYMITVIYNYHIITFLDSLKLLPFKVSQIGKNFKTQYQKLEMDYSSHTKAGEPITDEELAYIKNDVLVMHEAMNIIKERGMNKTTIGACCLSEFKKPYKKGLYRQIFPDLTLTECPFEDFANADEYIRKSYKGGWCYLKDGCENTVYHNGITCDVNSLYPSMMQSESGNEYPIGYPHWFEGEIPDKAYEKYYFVRFRCHFDLKKDHLPTVQIKGSPLYKGNEWLKTNRVNGMREYIDFNGKMQSTKVTLTMTMTDFELFMSHYDVDELEILDGCYFDKTIGLFDEYINYYAEMKINATNPVDRQISKLFLNNLYGKFASSQESSYKMFYVDEDENVMKSKIVEEYEKESGYIAIGSAITSYARRFTITAAQANYDSFVYADTDSIHCHDVVADDIKGAPRDSKKFNHWKYEASWDDAIFVRQKTYIEHVVAENLDPIDNPYYNIKCAGMGEAPRENLEKSLNDGTRSLTDFKTGLTIEGNLKAKITEGGTILLDSAYCMH